MDVSDEASVELRASTSTIASTRGSSTCVLVGCTLAGSTENKMVSVPTHPKLRAAVLKAAGRIDSYIDAVLEGDAERLRNGERTCDLRLCSTHIMEMKKVKVEKGSRGRQRYRMMPVLRPRGQDVALQAQAVASAPRRACSSPEPPGKKTCTRDIFDEDAVACLVDVDMAETPSAAAAAPFMSPREVRHARRDEVAACSLSPNDMRQDITSLQAKVEALTVENAYLRKRAAEAGGRTMPRDDQSRRLHGPSIADARRSRETRSLR